MVWAQNQLKWAEVAWKSFTYDVTHKKFIPPKQKIYFRVQTRRLPASFAPLKSSLPLQAPELRTGKAVCDLFFCQENPWNQADAKVLNK